jgi:hypothetical protein
MSPGMPVRLRLRRLPWAIFYHDNNELTGNLEKRKTFLVSLELCGWLPPAGPAIVEKLLNS